ncbi:MAG TPA: tetratricopeptide repeat protein [Gemmataceae bacterium]|nr:tetratricopeptide repeat protein [Gemmataceae bacterium]
MATIAETLATARRYHQAGAFQQAEQLYLQALQIEPRHAETLHMLGVIAFQAGNASAAIHHVQAALAVTPADGRFYATLGLAQIALQQLDDALASFRQSVRLMPSSAEAHYNLGLAFQKLGQWAEAAASYQQALLLKADFVQAHNNLGNVLLEQNQPDKALTHFQQAVRLHPGHANAHTNLGVALRRLGRLDEATASHRRALSLTPNSAQAHNNLGSSLREQGQLEQAQACFQEALRLDPNLADGHLNLGITLRHQGKLNEAVACFRHAVRLRPQFSDAYLQLGIGLEENGQAEEAENAYRQAVVLKPDHVDAGNRLGLLLQKHGRLREAALCLEELARLHPESVEVHNNLGNTYVTQAQFEDAAACFRRALRLKPDCAEAHNNLGSLLANQGHLAQAADCYRQALRFKPAEADAHAGLAGVLRDQGMADDAIASLKQALRCRASDRFRVSLATCLPVLYQSAADVESWRRRFTDEVRQLRERHVQVDITDEPALPLFYLTYQGHNDRDLQREAARLYRTPTPPRVPPTLQPTGQGKIRVGFMSSFFKEHTIGQWMRGLMAQLSRADFSVVVLSSGRHQDDVADFVKRHADSFVEIPRHLPAARQLIADQQLDVLVYTDIGMDPFSYTLAFSRLAPVQCVTLGHPVTTGIDTVDYFISTEALETEESDQHYTEQLIRLKHLPIHFYKPKLPADVKPRDHFGLANEDHVYACLQSLFKFHPQFDELLAGILRGDPKGKLILTKGRSAQLELQLRQRFATTMPDVLDRIRFFPPLSYAEYLNLLAVADVQLDPLPFGGGNTSYDGFALGNPIVTMPSKMLRGRITFALYDQMQILDCVASNTQDYISMALRLGIDAQFRDMIRQKILAAHGVLFENSAGIRDLEQFFHQAVKAASGGRS